jgi:hypothetical protein
MFTYNYFLVHTDIELTLWWNLVEATSAGIALHRNNSEAIACIPGESGSFTLS